MRETRYVCDKCRRTISGNVYGLTVCVKDEMVPHPFGSLEEHDLCEGCMSTIVKAIQSLISDPDAATPSTKKVDIGKIRALRNAGWTQKAIAEEMGVTPPTIAYHLKQMELTEGK